MNGSRDHGRRDHSQVRPNDVTDHADQWGRSRDHMQSVVRSRILDHCTGLSKMISKLYIVKKKKTNRLESCSSSSNSSHSRSSSQ